MCFKIGKPHIFCLIHLTNLFNDLLDLQFDFVLCRFLNTNTNYTTDKYYFIFSQFLLIHVLLFRKMLLPKKGSIINIYYGLDSFSVLVILPDDFFLQCPT